MMRGQEIGIVWFNGLQTAEYPMKDSLESLMIVQIGRSMAFLPNSVSEFNWVWYQRQKPQGGCHQCTCVTPIYIQYGGSVLSLHP